MSHRRKDRYVEGYVDPTEQRRTTTYVEADLEAGTFITRERVSDAEVERQVDLADTSGVDRKVAADRTDSTPGGLIDKLEEGRNVDLTPVTAPTGERRVRVDVTGVGLNTQEVTALVTSADGDPATAATFESAPGAIVLVEVNGVTVLPANGSAERATAACYFTDPTGVTVRGEGQWRIGDVLRWNGSMAGFQLDPTDGLKLVYEIR